MAFLLPELSTSWQQQLTRLTPEQLNNGAYCYQLDDLATHIQQLQQQNVVELWYAVKANPLSRIIQTLAQYDMGFDVASLGELNQVLAQGVVPSKVLNTGPAKSINHFQQMLKQGVNTFVIESVNQLNWLAQAAQQLNKTPKVLLRVQLDWQQAQATNVLGGSEVSVFGLAAEHWQQLDLSQYRTLNICGLHVFQWGNIVDVNQLSELWQTITEQLVALAAQLHLPLEVIDLGGGLGINYQQVEQQLSWQAVVEVLSELKAQYPQVRFWLELGRYAVAQCGYYLSPVVDMKQQFNKHQVVLAGGINHLLRPAITGQAFPARLLRLSEQPLAPCDVHGPLCTSLDKQGELLLPADVQVGDIVVFGYCGAYGFTESMPFFLCHDLPAEYCFSQGQLSCVRESQSAASYLR